MHLGTPINHEVDLKVVGGRPAKDGEVPYQVALKVRVPNYHFCGGSIISSRTILTSAQC